MRIATLQSNITVDEDVLFSDLGRESVVLNPRTATYCGLDEVATRMWVLLADHGQVKDVYNQLLAEYDVGEDQLREDLLRFVDELVSQQLVHIDAVESTPPS